MTLSDEILTAYADGELDAGQRAEIEAAMALDPEIARRVERAVRHPPKRATGGAGKRDATVTDLRRVRAARAAEAAEAAAAARRARPPRPPWSWFEWGAVAASVAAGAFITLLVLKTPGAERFSTQGGEIVAQADLDQALSNQLASDPIPGSAVRIGVSFRTKAGNHCRTFLVKEPKPLGGLACREGDAWQVQVLATAQRATGATGADQQVGAEMPAAVMAAAQGMIEGEPLDAAGEIAARARSWK